MKIFSNHGKSKGSIVSFDFYEKYKSGSAKLISGQSFAPGAGTEWKVNLIKLKQLMIQYKNLKDQTCAGTDFLTAEQHLESAN